MFKVGVIASTHVGGLKNWLIVHFYFLYFQFMQQNGNPKFSWDNFKLMFKLISKIVFDQLNSF